jgi:hypothetical protein
VRATQDQRDCSRLSHHRGVGSGHLDAIKVP